MTKTYDYAQGDLLKKRNAYAYTVYGGRAFMEAWRASRTEALADLPEPAAPLPARDTQADAQSGPGVDTSELLESIMAGLETGTLHPDLESLLQRFEVSKRIHGRYTEKWKPEEPADYTDLTRYLRFAETLDRAYAQLADLRYLNTLLKCIDTLVALRSRLDEQHAARLARLLQAEQAHIRQLDDPRA